jgi:hypothetical protein
VVVCLHVCVCVCMCVCVCLCACKYMHERMCMSAFLCACMYVCMCLCACLHVCVHERMCMSAPACVCVRVYVRMYVRLFGVGMLSCCFWQRGGCTSKERSSGSLSICPSTARQCLPPPRDGPPRHWDSSRQFIYYLALNPQSNSLSFGCTSCRSRQEENHLAINQTKAMKWRG